MNSLGPLKAIGAGMIATLIVVVGGPVVAFAGDTPSLGGGDCWRSGTPWTCRVTWAGRSTYIYFRAIDDYSYTGATWGASASTAVGNWNATAGPQYYSFTASPNDTWIYLHYGYDGLKDLGSGINGITWNCDTAGYCVDTNTAMNIWWTDVYINRDQVGNSSTNLVTETIAHESGHGMGLAHNATDSRALMWYAVNGTQGPQPPDIGAYPGCYDAGMECVYGFGD